MAIATVKYNGNRLIPGPLVSISKSYERTGAGNVVGSNFTITLTGKAMPDRGSPTSSGSFYTGDLYPADETITDNFGSLLTKREAIEGLFATDGQLLQFASCNGVPLTCYPTVDTIDIPESQMYQSMDYTISLSTPFVSGLSDAPDDFPQYLSSSSENWSLESTNEYEGPELAAISRLSHSVDAIGKKVYNANGAVSEGWVQARDWVVPRLGVDNGFLHSSSGLNLPAYYTGYDYGRTENTDELAGSYSVTENWLISSGAATEEFSISVKTSNDSFIDTVSVDGSIKGLEQRSSDYYTVNTTKWANALAKYTALIGTSDVNTIYNRALNYSGYSTLNQAPLTKVVGKNPTNGTINYSWEYDTRPTAYVSGAKYETISVSNTNASDVFGSVFALGRAAGPILQDLGTVTETQRSLAVSVVMQPYSGGLSLNTAAGVAAMFAVSPATQVDILVDAFYTNLSGVYSQVFVSSDTDDWDVISGKYSRNVTWIYGSC